MEKLKENQVGPWKKEGLFWVSGQLPFIIIAITLATVHECVPAICQNFTLKNGFMDLWVYGFMKLDCDNLQ